MKVVFVGNSDENLGIECLSAYLKRRGHETALVFDPQTFNSAKGINSAILHRLFGISTQTVARRILEHAPDLVAFSVFTYDYQWSLEVARWVKMERPSVPTVFGGYHPTLVPDVVIAEEVVDAAVVGEGEEPLLELVESLERGCLTRTDIRNVWFKDGRGGVRPNPIRPYIHDLDALPFPDKALYYSKVPWMQANYYTVTNRGCPYTCSFCCLNHVNRIYSPIDKEYVRQRSVENVLAELRWAKEYVRPRTVSLWDAIFGLDVRWLREFAPRYREEIGLPFHCEIHPNTINEEKAELLAVAGCQEAKIGLQSTNNTTLKEIRRAGTLDRALEGCAHLRKAGVPFTVDHILGLPGDGPAELLEALHIYNEMRPRRINTYWLVYFPRTDMVGVGKRARLLDDAMEEKIERGKEVYHIDFLRMNFYHHRRDIETLRTMFNLLPLMPRRIFTWMERHRFYRFFVLSNFFHQVLTGFRDLVFGDNPRTRVVLHSLFTRKAVP